MAAEYDAYRRYTWAEGGTPYPAAIGPDGYHYENLYGSILHNAGGTDNAPPGWSWVGEEGPELIRLHGGEQILPAEASRTVAAEYDAYRRYAGTEGGTNAHTAMGADAYRDPAGSWWGRDTEVNAGQISGLGIGKIELQFQIAAGAAPETVRAWQDYANGGELRETILEILEDVETDARRRALR